MEIRKATLQDAAAIADIYNWYVLNTVITFEVDPVSEVEMEQRLQAMLETHDWLVGEEEGKVMGYAYYRPYHPRAAYGKTVEGGIYLDKDCKGRGCGKALYLAAIHSAQEKGFRQFLGVIAYPNPASQALHRQLGFREVGVLEDVGYKFGEWIDVGTWQLKL